MFNKIQGPFVAAVLVAMMAFTPAAYAGGPMAKAMPCTGTIHVTGDTKSGLFFVCTERLSVTAKYLSTQPSGYKRGDMFWFLATPEKQEKTEAFVRMVVKEKASDTNFDRWSTNVSGGLMGDYRERSRYHEKPGWGQNWFDLGVQVPVTIGSGQEVTVWRLRPVVGGYPRMVHLLPMRLGDTFVFVFVGSRTPVDNDEPAFAALRGIHVSGPIEQFDGKVSSNNGTKFADQDAKAEIGG